MIQFREHTLVIPPPDASVAGWPLIGKPISDIWLLASQSLESAITTYKEPLSKLGMTIIGPLGGFGKSLIMFFVSVIIAGVFPGALALATTIVHAADPSPPRGAGSLPSWKEGKARGWTVVSMKDDWRRILPFEMD